MDKGAHFYRCDFQVHTPRDPGGWKGPRPTSNEERERFAEEFVVACRQKGVQAVAITEHHDMAFVPLVRAAARAETSADGRPLKAYEQLLVFPGIELTLAVPCQALLILDADFPDDRLSLVLEALAISPTAIGEARVPDPVALANVQSFAQLHEKLDEREWLRGRYIVLPNVSDSGHQTLLRNGMAPRYRDMPCVGGYVDGAITSLGVGNRRIVDGADKNYGNKRIAVFQTSDSRSSQFDSLGRHTTWVKWANPTAEALRQACLAQESRVSHTEPGYPVTVLTRVDVSNSMFMGPISLELNPQYNAVIGGRGTGKSTILEYIRWALCDQAVALDSEEDASNHTGRRQRLVEATLSVVDAAVDISFLINGVPHTVRRLARNGELSLRVGRLGFEPASEAEVRALLPIDAYSQKQLSSVAIRKEELTRFLTAPIRDKLDRIRKRFGKLSGEIRENFASLQRARNLQTAIARDALSLQSLGQQAESIRETLGGVSEEDRASLGQRPQYDQAEEAIRDWDRRVGDARDAVGRFRAEMEQLGRGLGAPLDGLPEAAVLGEIRTGVAGLLEHLGGMAREGQSAVRDFERDGSVHGAHRTLWGERLSAFQARYQAAKDRSTAHASRLSALSEVEERQRGLRETLANQRGEMERLGDPFAKHTALRDQWTALHGERSDVLREQCIALGEAAEGLIEAKLSRGAGVAELSNKLKAALQGSGVRTAKLDAFLQSVVEADDAFSEWEVSLGELEALAHFVGDDEKGDDSPDCPQLRRHGLVSGDLRRIASKLSADAWLDLALTVVEDQPSFRYRVREGEYIDFDRASAGQQATALLRALLSQSGPPLLIDQPEDDLDSQVVLEVVERLWSAKSTRQIIFASHNANLVVNGDADLVVCCDYRAAGDHSGGAIKLQGAIDIEDVRREITIVMEGGERAFRLRKDKYGF